ncbi:MAG: hypothetical protein OJF51_002160 [Nitrospira sp.]|nr:MAG: hypothetical protein OJF51_002160 [Nitrospira sp.]
MSHRWIRIGLDISIKSVLHLSRQVNQSSNSREKYVFSFELCAVDHPSILKEVLGSIEDNLSFNEERSSVTVEFCPC